MLRTNYWLLQDFVRVLVASLPFDASAVLSSVENGTDALLVARQLGRLLAQTYETQQCLIVSLKSQLAFWQQQVSASAWHHQAALIEEKQAQLHQCQAEKKALQARLANAEEQIRQLSLRCNDLEHEKQQLLTLIREQQDIIAHQQMRLFELDDDMG